MNNQKIIKKKLNNGLEIFFSIDKRYTTSTVLFGFKIGWKNDSKKYLGLAHLFEHLIGKRTINFKEKGSLDSYKEMKGIKSNALTFADFTYYFQNQVHENLIISIDLIFEAIYNSLFDQEDLNIERKVVLTEAKEFNDDDYKKLSYLNRKQVYVKHPYSNFFYGTKSSLNKINIEVFKDFYNTYKNPNNSILIISTNSEKDINVILENIDNFYSKYKNFSNSAILNNDINTKELIIKNSTKIVNNKNLKGGVIFSFVNNNLALKDKIYFKFIENILGNGFSGLFLKRLRDELGYIYWIDIYCSNWKLLFEINFYYKTNYKLVNKTISEILKILDSIKRSLDQSNIDAVKQRIIFDVYNGINSINDSEFLLETYLIYEEVITTEEYVNFVENMKVDEFKSFINETLNPEKLNITCL